MPRGPGGTILLGDVVISKTIIQYDFGRQYPDKFIRKNTIEDNLSRPNKDIRSLLATFETDRGLDRLEQRTTHFLRQLQANVAQTGRQGKYDYPGTAEDKLFEPTYRHKHHVLPTCICRDCFSDLDPVCDEALSSSCADIGCDDAYLIARERFQAKRQLENGGRIAAQQPVVHVGAVASGDTVMKSAADRDRLSREADVIAFEMEGAGVWDELPCIVVKGVCDYADSHKHKGWQNFAAATAASASKAILERYVRTDKALKASAGPHTSHGGSSIFNFLEAFIPLALGKQVAPGVETSRLSQQGPNILTAGLSNLVLDRWNRGLGEDSAGQVIGGMLGADPRLAVAAKQISEELLYEVLRTLSMPHKLALVVDPKLTR
jgi:nucleoside phosphorylase